MTHSNQSGIDLLDANETLKKCLVKISFAAAGIQKQMDVELQTLRELIRNDAFEDEIHDQVETIAKVLRALDEETTSLTANLSQQDLLENLQMLINAEMPKIRKKLSLIITKGENEPLLDTICNIADLFPKKTTQPRSLFSKIFSHKEPEPPENENTIERVSSTISQLLSQLHTPVGLESKINTLQQDLKSLNNLSEFPPVLEEISSIVLDISYEDQQRFESFLRLLGQKLDFVQQLIINTSTAQSNQDEATADLNKEMRDHVQQLHANIRHADSLKDLQESVQSRLEKVISSLDAFNNNHESFVEVNQKQLKDMKGKLSESQKDIKNLEQKLKDQQHLAETDMLTKLPNRYAFQRKIEEEYARWRRYRNPLSVAIADIDHFKKVNDNHGHNAGDRVLAQVAAILSEGLRESDFVARWGGEEFIITMPETALTKATKAINKLRTKIAEQVIDLGGQKIFVTISFGVAELEDNDPVAEVIKRADIALYRAKDKGRNQVCCEIKQLGN